MDLAVIDGETDSRDFGHALPTTVEFAAGETLKTITIPINGDQEGEAAETFQLALSNATGDAALATRPPSPGSRLRGLSPTTASPLARPSGSRADRPRSR